MCYKCFSGEVEQTFLKVGSKNLVKVSAIWDVYGKKETTYTKETFF